MSKFYVLSNLDHNGTSYKRGEEIDLTEEYATPLLKDKVISKDPVPTDEEEAPAPETATDESADETAGDSSDDSEEEKTDDESADETAGDSDGDSDEGDDL